MAIYPDPDDFDSGFYIPGQDPIYTPKNSDSNIDYTSPATSLTFKNTGSVMRTGGRGVTSNTVGGAKAHLVNRNADYITRDFKNAHANSIDISETITVVAGKVAGGASSTVSLTGGKISGYVTTGGNIWQGKRVNYGILTHFVHAGGSVTLEMVYATYLRVAGQNFSRGQFSINIEKLNNGTYTLVNTLVSTIQNAGVRTPLSSLGADSVSGQKALSKSVSLSAGTYYIVLRMVDTYADTDKDSAGFDFYGWANIGAKTVATNTKSDTSYAVAELIDLANGNVIRTQSIGYGGGSGQVNFTVPGNSNYRVRYTLNRGDGKTGGVLGNGGSMYASGGLVTQQWSEYSYKDPNNNFPYVPSDPGAPGYGGGVIVSPPGSGTTPVTSNYCWVDVFRLYSAPIIEREPDCFGDSLEVEVRRGSPSGTLVDRINLDDSDTFVDIEITNNTTQKQTYYVSMEYDHSCSGEPPLYMYGGRFIFNEQREPAISHATVHSFYLEEEQDVLYGATGSKLAYNVYDKLGSLIFSRQWDTEGSFAFNVSYLGHLPYPNYRAEFTTLQTGVVSPVTGINYLADLEVTDYRAHEIWTPTPVPFNSVLEFYIDDVVFGRWDAVGGGIVCYDVPKGNHVYKWVLTNKSSDYTYDFAEIDWFRLTNWICDSIVIVPYCEPGKGDKSIEALIKCLLEIWRQRPQGCVLGNKKVWLFT